MKDFPVGPCNANPYAFYFILGSKSVSCSHQGIGDVNEYFKVVTHKNHYKTIRSILSYHKIGGGHDSKKKNKS